MKEPKRNKSPWFAFYPEDYLGGTRVMTLAAKGAFVDLLNHQFLHGSIPDDDRSICRILGAFPEEWEPIKDEVLAKFPDGRNPRMSKEISEREEIRNKKIQAGRKGAEKRWQNDGTPNGSANGTPNGSATDLPIASTSTSTSTSESNEYSCPQADETALLLEIWNLAPSKSRTRSSKKKVFDAWRRVPKNSRPTPLDLITAIKAWSSCEDWTKDGGQFAPGLHLWIKDQKWEDLPEPPKQNQQPQRCL